MKKAIILLTPILIIIIAIGCSKDHDAPTFSVYEIANKPSNVVASYDKETDAVNVTWDMDDKTSVVDYFVSASDSSDFDLGDIVKRPTNSQETSYPFDVSYIPADVDSTILYFTVSAVYKNENLNYFIGPRADMPGSAVIKRD